MPKGNHFTLYPYFFFIRIEKSTFDPLFILAYTKIDEHTQRYTCKQAHAITYRTLYSL